MITNAQAQIDAQLSHASYGGTPPAGYKVFTSLDDPTTSGILAVPVSS